ncbi:MAG: hypothetical protein Aurels2KO_30850 [Aureliella sp.]
MKRLGSTLQYFSMMLCLASVLGAQAQCQEFNERFDDWPLHTRQPGSIVVAGDISDLAVLPDSVWESMGRTVSPVGDITAAQVAASGLTPGPAVTVSDDAIDAQRPLLMTTELILSSSQSAKSSLALAERHIAAGGVVILVGESALDDCSSAGSHLLPDCRVVTNYDPAKDRESMLEQLSEMPRVVGVGVRSGSVLILSGRKAMCFGSETHFAIASHKYAEPIEVVLKERKARQDINSWLVDLTQLRRRAIDHELELFPSEERQKPHVAFGTLMIVGGGGMPSGLMDDFVELAGGADAHLVYVPCLEDDEAPKRSGTIRQWRQMGVASATILHTKDRTKANEDEDFFAPLKEATGIWFGGGRQWNFADSYYGTTTHRMMKDVLARGGVIGGSSAGASIQARYLARATPIQNFDIMAPGYERGGLGFISGVAIDQHFSQRNRHKDMQELVARYPQLLGIGIDEATAITVRGSTAEVRGKGDVYFFDEDTIVSLPAGVTYDLADRKAIEKNK